MSIAQNLPENTIDLIEMQDKLKLYLLYVQCAINNYSPVTDERPISFDEWHSKVYDAKATTASVELTIQFKPRGKKEIYSCIIPHYYLDLDLSKNIKPEFVWCLKYRLEQKFGAEVTKIYHNFEDIIEKHERYWSRKTDYNSYNETRRHQW